MQNPKFKKLKTIQMNYPAPYSQSWANADPARYGMERMKKCSSYQANNMQNKNQQICNCCWRRPKPLSQGTNPYAPHLKYGVFPKKVNPGDPIYRPAKTKTHIPLQEMKPLNREKSNKDKKKDYIKEKRFSEPPLFIVRPINNEFTHQLSLSEINHIDIKPGTFKSRSPYRRLNKRY